MREALSPEQRLIASHPALFGDWVKPAEPEVYYWNFPTGTWKDHPGHLQSSHPDA